MASLSEDLRKEAYLLRRVPEPERLELEEVIKTRTHVVLLAPHVLPAKSYRALLHEAVPEIVSVFPEETTQVLAVIPSKDALSAPSRDLALGVTGAVAETVSFPKPAHRSPPLSPLALYQLRRLSPARR